MFCDLHFRATIFLRVEFKLGEQGSCKSFVIAAESVSLTHSGVSIRHQDDHGDGARVDEPLIGRPHQHLNCSHQCLVDVGTWSQKSVKYSH